MLVGDYHTTINQKIFIKKSYMTKQEYMNLVSIKDYFNLRFGGICCLTTWENTKRLNTHLGFTFWQLCKKVDSGYDLQFAPCLRTLRKVRTMLES